MQLATKLSILMLVVAAFVDISEAGVGRKRREESADGVTEETKPTGSPSSATTSGPPAATTKSPPAANPTKSSSTSESSGGGILSHIPVLGELLISVIGVVKKILIILKENL